jgi:hypothetical protein
MHVGGKWPHKETYTTRSVSLNSQFYINPFLRLLNTLRK